MTSRIPLGGTRSPTESARLALERADHLGGDPAAVEVPGLGAHRLAVDGRRLYPTRVEGPRTPQQLVPGGRILVGPRDGGVAHPVDDRIPVGRRPLELAHRGAGRPLEDAGDDVVPGHVEDRWMTGLAD